MNTTIREINIMNTHAVLAGSFALSLTLLFGSIAGAEETHTKDINSASYQEFGMIEIPACIEKNGHKVPQRGYSKSIIMSSGGFLAGAGTDPKTDENIIIYDNETFPWLAPEFQKFTLAHECQHIKLGDIGVAPKNRADYLATEDRADCTAFQQLKDEEGYGQKEVEIIAGFINLTMSELGAPASANERRIKALKTCALLP